MRWNIVRAIYLKELRETLRDRRTLIFMIALPLLLYPMMIIGLSRFQRDMEKESSQRTARLTIWGEAPDGLPDLLRSRNFEIIAARPMPDDLRAELPSMAPFERIPDPNDPDNEKKAEQIRNAAATHPLVVAARPVILDRATDLILVVWPMPPGKQGMQEVAILYDSVRQDSRRARTRLGDALDEYRETVLQRRESDKQLDAGFTKALRIQGRDVAPPARRSGFGAGSLLPFILLAISATAGFYRAVDTTAGEKERNTMQTLLCAPVRAIEIVAGKFAAIASITTLAAAANIISLGMTFKTVGQQGGMSMSLTPMQYLLVFAVLVPVTMLTSALFLAVGVFAKDFRDGQNLLTPVMMLTMMPAAITMLPNIESNAMLMLADQVAAGGRSQARADLHDAGLLRRLRHTGTDLRRPRL
jgi:sodium transport system permease protein